MGAPEKEQSFYGDSLKTGQNTAWNDLTLSRSSRRKRTVTASKQSSVNGRSESVFSTDSYIRFTRRKLGENQRCGYAFIIGFLLTLLFAGTFVFIGYKYFCGEPRPDKIFRGRMKVISGDNWQPEMAEPKTKLYNEKARDYRERVNLIFRRSALRHIYDDGDILALDGNDNHNDVTVHFLLKFYPYWDDVTVEEVYTILLNEIKLKTSAHLKDLQIEPTSLSVKEATGAADEYLDYTISSLVNDAENAAAWPHSADANESEWRCETIKLKYCKSLPYNRTIYPNLLGHNSFEEAQEDLIKFRELIDAECFRHAFDFICRLLQPPCDMATDYRFTPGQICRDYCQDFVEGCGDRISEKFKTYFDCERFQESTGVFSCQAKPGCGQQMLDQGLSARMCDGIGDCPDLSDELTCSYCPPKSMFCGRGRSCIQPVARCDGKLDCPDGSDEKDCLSIQPFLTETGHPLKNVIPHRRLFHRDGFVTFTEKGSVGKLCAEGLDLATDDEIRNVVATSLCKSLGYDKLVHSKVVNDTDAVQGSYVRVLDPYAAEISFVRSACHNRRVMRVTCDNLECGVQSISSSTSTAGIALGKMASAGDWPWHVSLFRANTHVCDGTLVNPSWVLTTESCFQGQTKATWIAVLGSIRLNSNAPWTQRRRIIGMIKSPVEGSTAVLVRLETAAALNDFVRPICLPDEQSVYLKATMPVPKRSRVPSDDRIFSQVNMFYSPNRNETNFTPITSFEHDRASADYLTASSILQENTGPAISLYSELHSPNAGGKNKNYERQTNDQSIESLAAAEAAAAAAAADTSWTHCNTLGWSRQKNHLQRVQLKFKGMGDCENISITTVNSMCTEALYNKEDCNEEEFAGTPVVCLLPDGQKWALVGVASWRIACSINGAERPRMYDKITSNAVWIRDVMSS